MDECATPQESYRGPFSKRFYTIEVHDDETVVYFVHNDLHRDFGVGLLWRSYTDFDSEGGDITESNSFMSPRFTVKSAVQNDDDNPDTDDDPSITIQQDIGQTGTRERTITYDEDGVDDANTDEDERISVVPSDATIKKADRQKLVTLMNRVLAIVDGTFAPAISEDTLCTFSVSQSEFFPDEDFLINPIEYCNQNVCEDHEFF